MVQARSDALNQDPFDANNPLDRVAQPLIGPSTTDPADAIELSMTADIPQKEYIGKFFCKGDFEAAILSIGSGVHVD